jgi:DNA-directed RNA polymerase specialized sigma24 family protein
VTDADIISSDDPLAGPAARWSLAHRRARAARDEEFTAFVAAAAPRLRRTAYLMCRDWHLAQDLAQITLAKMYASWGRIRQADNLEAYSRRVLMNTVFDLKMRRSNSEVVSADLPERPGPGPDAGVDLHVALLAALATLPVRDQAIVVLRHWEDQSVRPGHQPTSTSADEPALTWVQRPSAHSGQPHDRVHGGVRAVPGEDLLRRRQERLVVASRIRSKRLRLDAGRSHIAQDCG